MIQTDVNDEAYEYGDRRATLNANHRHFYSGRLIDSLWTSKMRDMFISLIMHAKFLTLFSH